MSVFLLKVFRAIHSEGGILEGSDLALERTPGILLHATVASPSAILDSTVAVIDETGMREGMKQS